MEQKKPQSNKKLAYVKKLIIGLSVTVLLGKGFKIIRPVGDTLLVVF